MAVLTRGMRELLAYEAGWLAGTDNAHNRTRVGKATTATVTCRMAGKRAWRVSRPSAILGSAMTRCALFSIVLALVSACRTTDKPSAEPRAVEATAVQAHTPAQPIVPSSAAAKVDTQTASLGGEAHSDDHASCGQAAHSEGQPGELAACSHAECQGHASEPAAASCGSCGGEPQQAAAAKPAGAPVQHHDRTVTRIDAHGGVCMLSNRYLGERPDIPIEVEGKTYHGCCANCAARLGMMEEARVATDPVTGHPVDKARALLAHDEENRLLYFESEATFAQYAKR
jgi:hypothetical protein